MDKAHCSHQDYVDRESALLSGSPTERSGKMPQLFWRFESSSSSPGDPARVGCFPAGDCMDTMQAGGLEEADPGLPSTAASPSPGHLSGDSCAAALKATKRRGEGLEAGLSRGPG